MCSTSQTPDDAPASKGVALVTAACVMMAAGVLLFARLGHYALWDDEANTALTAGGVWRTGDTTAVLGHNVLAFRGGTELKDMRIRLIPPLPAYLAAPFIGLLGQDAWAARLPFALCGFACAGFIVWWLWRTRVSGRTWLLMGLGLLGNVSFLLYCRQCRYYAVALLCTVFAAWWYLRWDGRRRALVWMALASMCLLASNTLNYVALYAVLAADYWLWGRHQRRLARGDWLALALPQVIFAVALFSVWNPLATAHGQAAMAGFNWMDRLTLFWWNWRDLNQCEFGVGGLLLAGAALCADRRQVWLRRGWVALAVYVTVITLLSPQTLRVTTEADVRYLAPLIPLCIAMSVLVLRALRGRAAWLAVPLAALAFGTNWLHGGPLLRAGLQSTVTRYVGELLRPPPDPYRAAAAWLNQHVAEKQSVLVQPDYAVYPLMFHAPKAVYAWQFKDPADPRFRGLDPVHFAGQVPPDYIVAFGPAARQLGPQLRAWEGQGIRYSRVAVLEIFWRDLHRPELFWRTFEPIVKFDVERDAVYVFQRRTSRGSHDGAR